MSIYMKIKGIEGNVTTKGYEGWIALDSIKKTTTRHDLCDADASVVTFDFVVRKPADSVSLELFNQSCLEQAIPKVTIVTCSQENDEKPILEYILHNVVISKLDEINKKDQTTIEELGLTFSAIEQRYMSYDASGASNPPQITYFDLRHNSLL